MENSDDAESVCAVCEEPLVDARYMYANGPTQSVFCSTICVRVALGVQRRVRWADRWRTARGLTIGVALLGGCLTPHGGRASSRQPSRLPRETVQAARDLDPLVLPPGWYGPAWPPTEMSLLAALGRDAWLHPLAGPVRRMPRTDARVFGAVRPGDRAVECRNGHCGVDLGGEIFGEHVRAVHDGVVDFVQRGANPDHGGRFVRLAHRNGTIFTQYFHLAAIPRGLVRGVQLKAGDVVGLLGDTGVKESAPHLHFAISIRPARDGPEKYVDPEPLIALWPLHVPVDGSEVGFVTTVAEPGIPLGALPLRAGARRRTSKNRRAPAERSGSDTSGPVRLEEPPASDDESSMPTVIPEAGGED